MYTVGMGIALILVVVLVGLAAGDLAVLRAIARKRERERDGRS